ncbi:hypothetical protein [Clostridium botulinum]|uniref:hypothetical protein n=1 Tax=Clostridium botulinum TaxID=1491 RepID=UPI00077356D4|nr:hypothetical protein [Clostridium botulinum]NFE96515.1 hypothetical protein [Clostridium botulinum]NFL40013.1 hypothetical protein [Clostridium botulinum]NFL67253.1 hypothetical protein [Clostridium botulinum]NFN09991.1 hypothetical protein [Clostridium botulinum]NFN26799.1 hypothetical protein [Clostridium botulinum]
MYTPKRTCSEEEKNVKRYNGDGYHDLGMVTENEMSNVASNPLTEHYHVKGFNDSAGEKSTSNK